MPELDDVWIPLVDEPIGTVVAEIEAADPELRALVASPRRLLAFRTFAYIRVGLVLGQLLVEHDVEVAEGSETWVEVLLRQPEHQELVAREIRAVAEEIAADPAYAAEESPVADEEAKARFREFARRRLESA